MYDVSAIHEVGDRVQHDDGQMGTVLASVDGWDYGCDCCGGYSAHYTIQWDGVEEPEDRVYEWEVRGV